MNRSMAVAVAAAVLTLASVAAAEDKADPVGTWKWKFFNQSAVHTLKLKLDADKLTGSIQNYQNSREASIEDAAYKDGMVSFKHTYKGRDGQQIVASYTGTVEGDTINGTIEIQHPERKRTIDWAADRMK